MSGILLTLTWARASVTAENADKSGVSFKLKHDLGSNNTQRFRINDLCKTLGKFIFIPDELLTVVEVLGLSSSGKRHFLTGEEGTLLPLRWY